MTSAEIRFETDTARWASIFVAACTCETGDDEWPFCRCGSATPPLDSPARQDR